MRVAVGSTNPVKVEAVKRAWRLIGEAEIIPVEVDSGVSSQPRGIEETYKGAFNRATRALEKTKADYGVGIEAGLVEAPTPTGWVDVQIAVIVDRSGVVGVGFSPAFEPPRVWIPRLARGEPLGHVASGELKRSDIGRVLGIIGYLTRGVVTRLELTYYAVVMALIPLLEPGLYPRGG
ncbi:protein of unknown function DUF84 [Pyrolobus fumarii 1A]|uniref:Probable inosine/xanthosine triphosphatase n=1 Tax=Pyrolobus fumarii (strain DSM 11204 / 1A) TaxID=694429 RepID=G0EH51_PYRF1|nr:inosine/xanthosine triphosphatase [Pyrolobus fumarii]AEM39275.1 protein of unknown function DUF84 [Pyrolobus fumarii 1A]